MDSDFRGEITVLLHNQGLESCFISKGQRIAQGVLCPVYRADFEVVDSLDETERGSGGLGSTGIG